MSAKYARLKLSVSFHTDCNELHIYIFETKILFVCFRFERIHARAGCSVDRYRIFSSFQCDIIDTDIPTPEHNKRELVHTHTQTQTHTRRPDQCDRVGPTFTPILHMEKLWQHTENKKQKTTF